MLWIVISVFYFFISYEYISASMSDREFGDYLTYAVQIAGQENRPPRELRQLVLVKAEQLGLPIDATQVLVQGEGQRIRVTVQYEVDTSVPLFRRGLLNRQFTHDAAYKTLR